MTSLTQEQIFKGNTPMQLWHWLGMHQVAPFCTTPAKLAKLKSGSIAFSTGEETKLVVIQHAASVVETAKAINRMMERWDYAGIPLEDEQS